MKSVIVATAIISVSILSDVHGQRPARAAVEQRNLNRASEWLLDVFSGMQVDRWKDYLAEDLIEHTPCCTGGLAEVLKYFTPPPQPRPRPDPVVSMVDGDLVLFVLPGNIVHDDTNPSRLNEQLRIEVIRMRSGKQAEHWGSVRRMPQGAAATRNARPRIAARNAIEQRNLKSVLGLWEDAFIPLNLEKLQDAYAEEHVEHHPCCTGRAEVMQFFAALKQRNPRGLPQPTLTHTLVDGELVALISVVGTEPDANDLSRTNERLGVDVLRVRNDQIVEHWTNSRRAPSGATISR